MIKNRVAKVVFFDALVVAFAATVFIFILQVVWYL